MILQALVRCYEALAERGELEKEGWSPVKVSWGLELDADGQVKSLLLMGGTDAKGKQIPRVMKLPDPVKRSSGVAANFLCDNSAYVLGIDAKGKPERTRECFAACARKHQDVLKDVRHPTAKAILNFFERWKPENAACHPAIQPNLETLLKGGNIVFVTHDAEGELQLAQDVPEIRRAWDEAYAKSDDAVMGRCLVTGEEGPIAILHPSIKGVMGRSPPVRRWFPSTRPRLNPTARKVRVTIRDRDAMRRSVNMPLLLTARRSITWLGRRISTDGWATRRSFTGRRALTPPTAARSWR